MTDAKTVMVIGDPHAHPRMDNDRFWELGLYAKSVEANHVHCVGDWTDFPSLNEHKPKAEQRPDLYGDDVEAGTDALVRFHEGLDGWEPRLTITLGNHDWYPARWVSENPRFEGVITPDDVPHKEYGWAVYPFLEQKRVCGFWVSHHFPASASSSTPQGGIHVAHHNLVKRGDSCVFGHNHRFDHKTRTVAGGRKQHAFSAGCMNHPAYKERWCLATRDHWDRGVLLLTMRSGRIVGFEWVAYDEMRRRL